HFHSAHIAKHVTLSPTATLINSPPTPENVTLALHDALPIYFNALGGADLVTVNDLSGTDVTIVNVDLAGTPGGATGDGQPDRIVVNATNGNDAIDASGDAQVVKVSGLAPTVKILHPEAANDRLDINTLAGPDPL